MERIFKKILKHKKLSIREKLKSLAYYYTRKRGAERSWNKRHHKVFTLHESYNNSCREGMESEHKKNWSAFRNNVDMSTLRICKNISGRADARIVPEDIFVSDIEPTLMTDEAAHFQSHKSFYNRWFPEGIFPKDILHCVEGQYLDSDLNPISFNELTKRARKISYPVVVKPNWDSYGGKDVFFIDNVATLVQRCEDSSNFVVQERIVQHEFFKKYNPVGLNTIRVYVYKSVQDNKAHIINMALRMGRGGSLDNVTSGGIHSMINEEGRLNSYAVDIYGKKFMEHPDTGYTFNDRIPAYDKLKDLALQISEDIYFTRVVGLDLCLDESGRWRAIEINTKGHTIRFSQYGGQPFFGKFTEEVIEYCKMNHWTLNKSI